VLPGRLKEDPVSSIADNDPRWDEAEAEITRGDPWRFRDPEAPNPLTIRATGWSHGFTKHGEADFLNGTDRDGNEWSVLVGALVLKKGLIEGEVSEWSDEQRAYVVVGTLGRVQSGEIVSIRFKGDVESGNGRSYPDFAIARRPAPPEPAADVSDEPEEEPGGDGVPF
jgi:hypothetical protein